MSLLYLKTIDISYIVFYVGAYLSEMIGFIYSAVVQTIALDKSYARIT
jgi:hypothetical protein